MNLLLMDYQRNMFKNDFYLICDIFDVLECLGHEFEEEFLDQLKYYNPIKHDLWMNFCANRYV